MVVTSIVRNIIGRQVLHFEEQPDLATLLEKWRRNELHPDETEIEILIDASEALDCTPDDDAPEETWVEPPEVPSILALKAKVKLLREALGELLDPPQGTDARDRITKGRFALEATKTEGV